LLPRNMTFEAYSAHRYEWLKTFKGEKKDSKKELEVQAALLIDTTKGDRD
jgi:hypothetical protein